MRAGRSTGDSFRTADAIRRRRCAESMCMTCAPYARPRGADLPARTIPHASAHSCSVKAVWLVRQEPPMNPRELLVACLTLSALAGCASLDQPNESLGPFPDDYKTTIREHVLRSFFDPYSPRGVREPDAPPTTDSSPRPPVPPPVACRPNPTTPSRPSAHGHSRCAPRASARSRSRSRWRVRGIRSGR